MGRREQHEVYTLTTARQVTLSGVRHVMLTRKLFTRTPLVWKRSSPIGQNNESRDWWNKTGLYCMVTAVHSM